MKLESVNLHHHEWLLIHEATLDFHRQATLEGLRMSILQWTKRMIPADTASLCDNRGGFEAVPWVEVSSDGQRVQRELAVAPSAVGKMLVTDFGRDIISDREAYLNIWDTAPNVPDPAKVPHIRVQQFSEYHTTREFRKTQLYSEGYAPVDQEMWIGVELHPGKVTVALARQRMEFNPAEMLKLELLRPQIEIAYHRLLALGNGGLHSENRTEFMLRFGLTPRESHVLHWLSEGKTNPEIGLILGMSRSTVKTHLLKIYPKLGCETRTAATRWVLEKVPRQ